jgi:very-short-patch-repair endonuclease
MKSKLEEALLHQIHLALLPEPEREYTFHPKRKWRLDFAWESKKLAAEVEGGIWTRGRHVRGKGFEQDCYKENEALLLGWRIFHFTSTMIHNGEALQYLELALRG